MLGLGLAEAVIAMQMLGPSNEVENTLLAQRIASGREIREALNKPLPPIEPLPAVTAKLANPPAVKIADSASRKNPWSKTNSLPPDAINAMAKSLTTDMPELAESGIALDSSETRLSPRRSTTSRLYNSSRTFDRAAGNSGF
jgi:hypothetical protein